MPTTLHGTRRVAGLLSAALVSSLALSAAPTIALAVPTPPTRADTLTVVPERPTSPSRYLSAPPEPSATPGSAGTRAAATQPGRAPTRGWVTGRVLTPTGQPFAGALVQGVRFDDLGPGINFAEEQPVLARTDAQGRFRLPQLTERYLLRICDAEARARQCVSDRAPDRYAPTYVGPDGVHDSWVRHTRLFTPVQPTRALPSVRMKSYARLSGTARDKKAGSVVHLVRGNGTEADRAKVDSRGRYRFAVVPGRYRVEADRHEGLRTAGTVLGYRSGWLDLTAAKPTTLNFSTRPAAAVTGRLTVGGRPVVERIVAIVDSRGRWAAGTLTDATGRYRVESLKPGRYQVQTLDASSAEVPVSRSVTLATGTVVRADLETTTGAAVQLRTTDAGRRGEVDLEIRNDRGELVKGALLDTGQRVRIPGLRPGTYQLVVRRAVERSDDREQTDLPWAQRTVTVTGSTPVDLGEVALDQPTLRLSGTLPRGAQVKLATVPSDAVLRPEFVNGPSATTMTQVWTEQADGLGRYTSHGLVPGRYAVTVSTALRDQSRGPSTTGANVAVTHSTLVVGAGSQTADLTAPVGGIITGELRYAGSTRPLIAPVGYAVRDGGDQSTLFPTTSGPQTYDRGFRVERLHAGPVSGQLFDAENAAVAAEAGGVLVPDSLLRSAPVAERRTPYWLAADPGQAQVGAGRVTTLPPVAVTIRR